VADAQPGVPKLPRTGDEDFTVAYYLLGVMGSLAVSVLGSAIWRAARRRHEDEYTLTLK
jgi:LPXTG-motif cell wall-anchored protein